MSGLCDPVCRTRACVVCGQYYDAPPTAVDWQSRALAAERERDEYRRAVDAVLAALHDLTGDGETYPLEALGERVRTVVLAAREIADAHADMLEAEVDRRKVAVREWEAGR